MTKPQTAALYCVVAVLAAIIFAVPILALNLADGAFSWEDFAGVWVATWVGVLFGIFLVAIR